MTSWLRKYAEETHRLPSSLWRILSAGRYYRELQRKFKDQGIPLPDLIDPTLAASPESLELLHKISRVAPRELLADELRVMKGELSRRDLREIWFTYRPVMQGRTARGASGMIPKFDFQNKQMSIDRDKGEALNLIRKTGPGWLGKQKPYIYKVIPTRDVPEFRGIKEPLPDAFLLYSPSALGPLSIQPILVPANRRQVTELQKSLLPTQMDGIWLAIRNELLPSAQSIDLNGVGILILGEDNLEASSQPCCQEGGSDARDQILKKLLLVLMRPD